MEFLGSKYVKVADLDTGADGYAIKDSVEILSENEAYYLVETKAPDGYVMIDHPIQVNLEIKKDYYPAITALQYMREHDGTSAPETTLYSMVERSRLTLADDPAVHRTNADGTIDLTHEGLNYDIDTITTMYFNISNNPGVSLPNTGGPGNTLLYVFGTQLVGTAGVGLVLRRRRKTS